MPRRLALLLLALLLPIQLAWGVAATYCQHESPAQGVGHFGHHVHVHHADESSKPLKKYFGDADCGFCHASTPAVSPTVDVEEPVTISSTAPVVGTLTEPASVVSATPDRPQWMRLA